MSLRNPHRRSSGYRLGKRRGFFLGLVVGGVAVYLAGQLVAALQPAVPVPLLTAREIQQLVEDQECP